MTVTERASVSESPAPREVDAPLARLNAACDGAGLGVFRAAFGALMLVSVVRFWAYGWIDEIYRTPQFHFTYLGFEWVRVWPGLGMYVHFAFMALAAASLALGFFSRASALAFALSFTYAELLEKASYLNHYYFVSLLSLLLAVLPSGAAFSLDARRRRRQGRPALPVRRWVYALLRLQVGLVYVFAGFAKLNSDWLLRAEPLSTWLATHADVPLLGRALSAPLTAYLASYAGAAFDLTIPFWLLMRRTRKFAYAVLVLFHFAVWLLFPIGVFSWVMMVSAALFFEPDWPRALFGRWGRRPGSLALAPGACDANAGRLRGGGLWLAATYLFLQLAIPLRFLLYPPDVNWHEQGFRFSWRVMLVEKTGQVEFRLESTTPEGRPERHVVYPREALTPLQYKMMVTQPDMIHEYARHLKRLLTAKGHASVHVFADAWVSFNGRPRQRLIDPEFDLGSAPRSLWAKSWILPLREQGHRTRAPHTSQGAASPS